MAFEVSLGENATVDRGVKRLHPAVEDLGEIGHLFNATHGHTRLIQRFFGAPGAIELYP
ncbi:hypothetical protein ES703_78513 [subsurface metagenome]